MNYTPKCLTCQNMAFIDTLDNRKHGVCIPLLTALPVIAHPISGHTIPNVKECPFYQDREQQPTEQAPGLTIIKD
jgi:hypothetical protein